MRPALRAGSRKATMRFMSSGNIQEQPANGIEKFCSRCGTTMILREDGGRDRPACPACGHMVFGRFTLGAGGLLKHEGRTLLIRRACEPGKGRWTLPGGYVEEDESPDQAIAREVLEETGLRVSVTGLLLLRHAQSRENQNAYYVFGLKLAGPIEDMKPSGDGHEVDRVVLVKPEELDGLGPMGMISRWAMEHCDPAKPPLAPMDPAVAPTPVPGHAWTQLLA